MIPRSWRADCCDPSNRPELLEIRVRRNRNIANNKDCNTNKLNKEGFAAFNSVYGKRVESNDDECWDFGRDNT